MHHLIKSAFLILLLAAGTKYCLAQDDDYTWWNNKHNWDGHSPWTSYLTYSPAYFGPNALPVPEIRDAAIDKRMGLESRADLHFSTGDNTQNLFLKLHYPFWDGRVAVQVYGVPAEHFIMDTLTRDERAGRDKDARGVVAGDVHFSTLIQLLRNKEHWPDLLLGFSFRAPSGGGLGNARYTDAPGYHFDISGGKSFALGEKLQFRPYLMLGFYVWQTNLEINPQNDAFLYGAGLSLFGEGFECHARWGGYKGYLNNGDAPMVLRARASYSFSNTDLRLSFQQGLHDFEYSTVSLGVVVWVDM